MPVTLVLPFQPLAVTSVHDGAPPFRVLQVPADGLADAGGEIHGRLKPQFAGDFSGVDGVATVMVMELEDLCQAPARSMLSTRFAFAFIFFRLCSLQVHSCQQEACS